MIDWLLQADVFNAKTHCGTGWSAALLWAYAVGNLLPALLYQLFPFYIVWKILPRHLPNVRPTLWALVVFVSTCGLTHVAEMMTIWYPAYRLVAAVHLLNTLTSFTGFVWLLIAIRRIQYIPQRAELEDDIQRLQDEVKRVHQEANIAARESLAHGHTVLNTALNALRNR